MIVEILTLFVSLADLPAAHRPACVARVSEQRADAPVARVADGSAHRDDRAASRRDPAPVSPPPARFAYSPRVVAHVLYAPPALAPREQAATPSSQRDPPDSLA